MRRLILTVFLMCGVWVARAADPVEKGTEDLLRNTALSQPFTVFDQLLVRLEQRAREVEKSIQPESNDFRPSQSALGIATSRVSFDKSAARTVVQFEIFVSSINDPWREVCEKRLKDIVTFGMRLPYSGEWKQEFKMTITGFFAEFLGARLTADNAQLANYKPFSDSLVVMLSFMVEKKDRKGLAFLRQCFWDNKTSKVSFREHKNQPLKSARKLTNFNLRMTAHALNSLGFALNIIGVFLLWRFGLPEIMRRDALF